MGAITDIKDILRGAAASLGGFGGRMLARLILMLVAGHFYGAASLGLLGQVGAIAEILAAVAVLGLKRSLLDFLSAKDAGEETARLVKEALCASLGLAIILSALLAGVWPYLFPDIAMPMVLFLAIPSIVFAEVAGTAIRFKRIIRWEVIARCIMEPWTFLIFALLFYALGNTETGLIAAYALSCLAAGFGILLGLHRAFGLRTIFSVKARPIMLLEIPKRSFPVGVTDIGVMMFRRMDILVLSTVVGHDATGIYYMAQQIVTIPHKIHQLFEPMMSPVIAKLHHAQKRDTIGKKLAGFCRWTFTLQLGLTVPFAIFGGQLLGLFGDQFTVGILVLAALLVAELVDGSFALTETALVFARPTLPPRLVLATLILELVAIAGFSYLWQAEGAALGFMVAMIGLSAARLVMLKRHLHISILGKAFLPPLMLATIVGAALYGFKLVMAADADSLFAPAALSAIAIFLILVRLLALTPEDKNLFRRLRTG